MEFVKKDAGNFFLFFLLAGANGFIWLIYDLPLEPIVYILVLTGVFFALWEGYRCYRFYQAKKVLERAARAKGIDFSSLPAAVNPLGQQYRELLEKQEKKLQRLSARYESSIEDRKEYYSMWVHQIKTPIAGIRLLLSEEPVDKKAVTRELYRIEQYVDTTLWYQRFKEGNNDLLIKSYPADALLKEVIKRNSPVLLRKDLTLDLKLQAVALVTDRKWLEFILEQLLGNAAKYTKNGTICIRVKDMEDMTDVIIEDTGIGIPPEDIPRIFEWGYTGWNGHENKKSTGIGLALSKRAAQLLGHELFIDSEPGKGTRAVVRIFKPSINFKE